MVFGLSIYNDVFYVFVGLMDYALYGGFQNLIRIFENMQKEIKDSSIIIISHQEKILRIADEIVLLSGGTIKKQGSVEDILPELIGTTAAVDACERLK